MSNWEHEDLISIRERAYRYLKNLIIDGDYKAGDRLIERELAEKLNISRTPIREALFRLESQGFVQTVARKGVIVSNISKDEVIEVFTILSSLEVLAAKLAAQKMNDEMMMKFDFIIQKLEMLDPKQDKIAEAILIETNQLLYEASKSKKLYEILSGLTDYIRIFSNRGYETPGRREESIKEHLEILKAIRNKEIEMAEYLTRIHIENSKRAYISNIDKVDNQKKGR
jgi:DNA-binding GntR family transcriptional regulator